MTCQDRSKSVPVVPVEKCPTLGLATGVSGRRVNFTERSEVDSESRPLGRRSLSREWLTGRGFVVLFHSLSFAGEEVCGWQ
jgi:hypothetical protein